MAKEEIFTSEQKKVLDLISKEDYIIRKFYFTGGTPLAVFLPLSPYFRRP